MEECITITKKTYDELIVKASRYDAMMLDLRPALADLEEATEEVRATRFSPFKSKDIDAKVRRLSGAEVRVIAIAAVGAGVGQ